MEGIQARFTTDGVKIKVLKTISAEKMMAELLAEEDQTQKRGGKSKKKKKKRRNSPAKIKGVAESVAAAAVFSTTVAAAVTAVAAAAAVAEAAGRAATEAFLTAFQKVDEAKTTAIPFEATPVIGTVLASPKSFALLQVDQHLQEQITAAEELATPNKIHQLEEAITSARLWCEKNSISIKKLSSLKQAKRKVRQLQIQDQPNPKLKRPQESLPKDETEGTPLEPSAAKGKVSEANWGAVREVGNLTWHIGKGAVLGEGSNGTKVYRGKHAQWGNVAVKVTNVTDTPEHRCSREQTLLLKLAEESGVGSDNVVKYRCREDTADEMMLGIEMCECSLHQLVTERKLIPTLQQQQRVVRELCEGTAFLHAHNIVHRDLRPKNILFKTNGFEGTVKVTDFGLAKDIDTSDANQSFSTTTVQAGTEVASFGFYAPEVYRRENPTSKVDVFSLGCSIFYMLTGGHRPHEDPADPFNKYALNANIYTGTFNLALLREMPEATHMISAMITPQKEARPTVQQLLEWHPYFWSQRRRFEFLCAVGNEDSRKAAIPQPTLGYVIGRSAAAAAGGWRRMIDAAVWEEYTSDSNYRQNYDTRSVSHLLRFMRNASQHTKSGSSAAAAFMAEGGMENYFVDRFPRLLIVVWEAVSQAGWGDRTEFEVYLPSANAQVSRNLKVHERLPTPSMAKTRVGRAVDWTEKEVAEWLGSIGNVFVKYGDSFINNGINGEELLNDDFGDAELKEFGVTSKVHRKRILRELNKLSEFDSRKHDRNTMLTPSQP